MKRQRPEEALQRQVCQYLGWALGDNCVFMHIPNGGLRSRTEAIRFKAMGVLAGAPDLLVIHNGRTVWLELKADKGRLSERQSETHDRLRAAHCPVSVCRSLDDVIEALIAASVPLRTESRVTERIRAGFAAAQGQVGVGP